MGYQLKWVRSVAEITGLTAACFLVLLMYFYASGSSSDSFTSPPGGLVDWNLQTSGALEVAHKISETKGNMSMNPKTAPILSCDLTNFRSTVCEIYSNVRIHGSSSTVFITSNWTMQLEENKTLRIRPYTRKFDAAVMKNVREVTIKHLSSSVEAPKCDINHNIPAILFASAGYTGNYFHDFSDVLLPLFITAHQFDGKVQMVIADMHFWWVSKYNKVLNQLSNYEIIDFNKENKVHCYPRLIVGLYSHGDLTVDPSKTPNHYSMIEFARLLRRAYSLERDFAINLVRGSNKKPKILIIARNHTRKITNVDEVVASAEEFGFEVVVKDAAFHTNVGDYARMVNSFDVMMGVHGAGLTNEVFLPMNAVLIQIVPFGNLESISEHDFGEAARSMMLNYIQYSISEEESTLIDLYPRDHAVFRDPKSISQQGWETMGKIYLVQQNVKLNITRFKPVLARALELLGF